MLEVGINMAKHNIAYIHIYIHVFYLESYTINSISTAISK